MTADFGESVSKFKTFVEEQNWSPHLIWVRPDDVVVDGRGQVFVKVPVHAENEDFARTTFENGIRRQLGVLFATLCRVQSGTCCYAWAPEFPEEAEYRLMPEGLKMSVRTGESRSQGKLVKNGLYWRWLKWRYRKWQDRKSWWFQ